jgi:sec-independent protein translocase protein TatC
MPRDEIKHKIMPFGQHLEELRTRLIYALLGIAPILIVSLIFGRSILEFVVQPVRHALRDANMADALQTTGVVETFGSYLKISITVTLVVGLPWVVWQLWMFVAPGLYASEKRFAYLLAPLSVLLSTIGVIFCFRIMLPVALTFFINFAASIAEPTVSTAPTPSGVALPAMPVLAADPTDPAPG